MLTKVHTGLDPVPGVWWRPAHKAEKLWQWKLRLETVRHYIERAMKETGSRELAVVMPRVRQWLNKEQTNLAAKILIHNI